MSQGRPLAYSYIRMSTDVQLKGNSLLRQTELSKDYAAQHDLTLVDDFRLEDIGVSAFKGDNVSSGALSRFLEAVETGRIPKGSFLLVESLDRLSRERITAAMQLFLRITENGVNIVTLSDGQVYRAGQTDFPQLVYSMAIMSRANEESRTKSMRISAAWKNKRDHAGTKKLTSMAPKWLRVSDDRLRFEAIEERVVVVRRIFQLAVDGHGVFAITNILNRELVPTFGQSNGWNESYVEKILKTRAVLGEFQPHSFVDGKRKPVGEPIADYYPVIIDETLFLRVQAERRKRATYGGGRKGANLKNLFTHVATCSYCGAPMRMVDKGSGPKGGRYLKCSAGVRGLACTRKSWRYEDFESSFLFVAREVDLAGVLNAASVKAQLDDVRHRFQAAEEKLRSLGLQRERLVELLADPTISTDYLRTKLADCQQEIDRAEETRALLRADQQAMSRPAADNPDDLRATINALRGLSGADALTQRTRLASRLKEIVVKLEVAVEGERPKLEKMRQYLAEQEPDAEFRDAMLKTMNEANLAAQRYNPSFTVEFADGVVRRATVSVGDPLQYISESKVAPSGQITIEIMGQNAFGGSAAVS